MSRNFKLSATVRSRNEDAIRIALEEILATGSVEKVGNELVVKSELRGASAKEANGALLLALKRVEINTTMRSALTLEDTTYTFRGYELMSKIKA